MKNAALSAALLSRWVPWEEKQNKPTAGISLTDISSILLTGTNGDTVLKYCQNF